MSCKLRKMAECWPERCPPLCPSVSLVATTSGHQPGCEPPLAPGLAPRFTSSAETQLSEGRGLALESRCTCPSRACAALSHLTSHSGSGSGAGAGGRGPGARGGRSSCPSWNQYPNSMLSPLCQVFWPSLPPRPSTPEPRASPQGCQLPMSVSMATPHLLFWFLMTYWHVW